MFVYDYPAYQCALAKLSNSTRKVAERLELFINGMEIANGYSELNDPREQDRRMREQVEGRGDDDEVPPAVDEDYIVALEHGMPPAAGIGIGIDRLVMLAADTSSIRDVILFPLLRPRD